MCLFRLNVISSKVTLELFNESVSGTVNDFWGLRCLDLVILDVIQTDIHSLSILFFSFFTVLINSSS